MGHSLGLAVYWGEGLVSDEIVLHGVSPGVRRVPVEDPEVCLKV